MPSLRSVWRRAREWADIPPLPSSGQPPIQVTPSLQTNQILATSAKTKELDDLQKELTAKQVELAAQKSEAERRLLLAKAEVEKANKAGHVATAQQTQAVKELEVRLNDMQRQQREIAAKQHKTTAEQEAIRQRLAADLIAAQQQTALLSGQLDTEKAAHAKIAGDLAHYKSLSQNLEAENTALKHAANGNNDPILSENAQLRDSVTRLENQVLAAAKTHQENRRLVESLQQRIRTMQNSSASNKLFTSPENHGLGKVPDPSGQTLLDPSGPTLLDQFSGTENTEFDLSGNPSGPTLLDQFSGTENTEFDLSGKSRTPNSGLFAGQVHNLFEDQQGLASTEANRDTAPPQFTFTGDVARMGYTAETFTNNVTSQLGAVNQQLAQASPNVENAILSLGDVLDLIVAVEEVKPLQKTTYTAEWDRVIWNAWASFVQTAGDLVRAIDTNPVADMVTETLARITDAMNAFIERRDDAAKEASRDTQTKLAKDSVADRNSRFCSFLVHFLTISFV